MSTVQPGSELPARDMGTAAAGPTVLRIILGYRLRRLREAVGVTREEAGYEIRSSVSRIARMERGRVTCKERDIADLLTFYGVTNEEVRAAMFALARQANTPNRWSAYSDILADWSETYLGLEAAASRIRPVDAHFVHALFQTAAYARAVIHLSRKSATAEEVDRRVSLLVERQRLLTSSQAPHVWCILDEAALRRPVGGPAVMRHQLNHLIDVSELPNVTLQVLPFNHGAHTAPGGSFTVLSFREPDLPNIVYIEHLTSALYLDRREDVDRYVEVMDGLSASALTPAATARFLKDITRET